MVTESQEESLMRLELQCRPVYSKLADQALETVVKVYCLNGRNEVLLAVVDVLAGERFLNALVQ